jgi:hypothetical protein
LAGARGADETAMTDASEPIRDNEIDLISDGDGLAVIGTSTVVERFMASVGLSKIESQSIGTAFRAGSSVAQTASEVVANSGRWVKLTEESAQKVQQFDLMPTSTAGVSHAMIGQPGPIQEWIQIVNPGSMLINPAMLTGAAGIMAQLAMQQSMAEITDYLAKIDEKLDSVLRAQTNQVLARMDGVALAVKEAMSVRESVGPVSEVTWSKVQNSAQTIHETQGYALRQLADLADKIEEKTKVGELAKIAKDAEVEVEKWLTVLARCFQLHDAVGVLELDRVLDASPDELDRHRIGLKAARQDRLEIISESTERLLARMNSAVDRANSKVLFNPTNSPAVVRSRNNVAIEVFDFHGPLGIESGRESSEAKHWKEAAAESWDKARVTGTRGIGSAKQFGSETRGQAKSARDKLSDKIAKRALRRRDDG